MQLTFNPQFRMKFQFFDASVYSAVNRGKNAAQNRFGGYVRKSARSSIKKVGKRAQKAAGKAEIVSRPGQPPYNKTGLLRDFIFYAKEEYNDSVIIGPERINQVNAVGNGNTIPAVLEYGGSVKLLEHQNSNGKWVRTDLRFRKSSGYRSAVNKPRRSRMATYEPRPYMGPAFEATKQRLPDVWQDCIK